MTRHTRLTVIALLAVFIAAATTVGGLLMYWSTTTDVPRFDGAAPAAPADPSAILAVRRTTPPYPPNPPENTLAADALDRLPVRAADDRVPYSATIRARQFGGWITTGGCDTRGRILARDAVPGTARPADCPATADIVDAYTGATLPVSKVQIDHVVSLGDAWRTGAQQLTRDERTALATDPRNLRAVSGRENMSKGDDPAGTGPNTYLPPLDPCAYVAEQVKVKTMYRLWTSLPEHRSMAAVLRGCPGRKLADS